MIGVLVFPDFQLLDATGPISAFEISGRLAAKPAAIRVLAIAPGPVKSSSGVELVARGIRSAGALSTLIVAGGEGVHAASQCPRTLGFVRAPYAAGDEEAWLTMDQWASLGCLPIGLSLLLVARSLQRPADTA